MTWFGKILAFVVLVASVVWMFFTAQAYVTRTNWKVRADNYESAYKAANTARVSEHDRYQAEIASLKSLYSAEKTKRENLETTVKKLSDDAATDAEKFRQQQNTIDKGDVEAAKLQSNINRTLAELGITRDRNTKLENDAVALVLETENAKKEAVKAKNEARLAAAIADDNAKKVEDLLVKVNELRATGGSATATVLKSIEKPPPPVLANLRGEVTDVAGELLTISVGIDAGMAVGTVLDIYRVEGTQGKYLGTVKVTSALNLFHKQAIVTFTPANRRIPFSQLPVGDLPRKGDVVRPAEALTGPR